MTSFKTLSARCAFLATASLMPWLATSAAAQSTAPSVEEIVVTAQKRAEALEDVPISITAVTGTTLERSGLTRLEDISRLAAGVQISRTGIFTQPAIRGVTTAQGNFAENNVAIYIDGFYIPSARGLNTELSNIAQVTVLKGPQGTLFGRNATGGAIQIETIQPSLTEFSGRIGGSIGRYQDRRLQGYVNLPVSDKIGVQIAGNLRQSDGYIKDVRGFNTAPLDIYTLALKVLIQPTDDLSLTLSANTNKVEDGRALANTPDGRVSALRTFPGTYVEFGKNKTSFTHPVLNRTYQQNYGLKTRYDFGGAALTSYTFYQYESSDLGFEAADSTALVFFETLSNENWRTLTQEVNLTSQGDGPLQYVLGAYYFRSKQRSPRPGTSLSLTFPSTVYVGGNTALIDTESYALYADGTYQVSDRLFLTAGIRYSWEKKGSIFRPPPSLAPLDEKFAKADSFTPRAVVRYELDDDTNVYGSFSKGFKSGVINNVFPYDSVEPEKITAFELGFKTVRGSYRFDAAAYHYDYKNLQVASIFINPATGGSASIVTNAATAEIYGAEMQLQGRITEQLNVNASLAYTHARYDQFLKAVVSVPNPTTGLNSASCGTALCTQDQSGLRMLRAPDWSANLSADYTIPVSFGSVILSGNVSWQSFQLPTKSDRALTGSGYRYGQKGYGLLNLQVAWRSPDDSWTVTAYGNNITDTTYAIVRTGTAFADYHTYGEPATYGVKLDYRF